MFEDEPATMLKPTAPEEAIELLLKTLSTDERQCRVDDAVDGTVLLGNVLRELGIDGVLDELILETAAELRSIRFKSVDSLCEYPGVTNDVVLQILQRLHSNLILPEIILDSNRPIPEAVVAKSIFNLRNVGVALLLVAFSIVYVIAMRS